MTSTDLKAYFSCKDLERPVFIHHHDQMVKEKKNNIGYLHNFPLL